MRIAVYTNSSFLYQKIKLAVSGKAEAVRVYSPGEAIGFELLLADAQFALADIGETAASEKSDDDAIIKLADPSKFGHRVGQSSFIGELRRLEDGGRTTPRTVLMGEGCELPLPFTYDMLLSVIDEEKSEGSALMLGEGCAFLRGEKICLTEVEFALFRELYLAGGDFVTREALLRKVWGEGTDSGVVNVYVHYLRQKLERGERIIVNSRMSGYKIDARFLKGEDSRCYE